MQNCAAVWAAFVLTLCAAGANAQTESPRASESQGVPAADAPPVQPVPVPEHPVQDKRILGVLPNYRTIDGTIPFEPLTTRQKFTIATKDSFDWPGFILAGAFSGFYQLDNSHPSFGQGVEGYAHRYVTSYGDQVIGNMMTEAIVPSLFHEDPRYFRKINGTKKARLFYAVTRVLVTRTDAGGTRFNFSEVLGNGAAASIGNFYYPDERGFGDTVSRMGISIGTDAISDVLKEFWPDIKRHYWHKHVAQVQGD